MSYRSPAILLLLLFLGLYLLPLNSRPLLMKDETRYAEVPREMVASGDWVVPRINNFRYFEKPALGYWLTAVSLSVFGENNFAVRFSSAISTGLTAALIYFMCFHFFCRRRHLPWLAVLIYLSSLGVTAIGTFAVLDTSLSLFLTAAMVSFFLATEEKPGSGKEKVFLAIAGICAGSAFLIKGFLAFAVPVLVIVPYFILQKRWVDIVRMAFLPFLFAFLISLPWSIMIYLREPDFWNYFFWVEHIHRFFSPESQRAQPIWFFLAVLPAMFLPWIFMLPAAIRGTTCIHPNHKEKRAVLFCLCWFILPFIFFSVSTSKLVTYILPCFPPLTILFALGLNQWLSPEMRKSKELQWGITILMVVLFTTIVALVGGYLFNIQSIQVFQESTKLYTLAAVLIAMLVLLFVALKNNSAGKKLIFYALSFCLLLFTANFIIPTQVLRKEAPGLFLERYAQSITKETYILSGGNTIRAVCWYLQRNDIYLIDKQDELTYGINYPDSRHKMLSVEGSNAFIRKHRGQTVLFAEEDDFNRWRPFLPEPVSIDSNGPDGFLLVHF